MITNQAEYDAAKAKLHNMPLHTNELLLASMEIEKQLLAYRCQNNIFEVGDWVVVGGHRVLAQFVGYAHKGTPAELPQIDIDGRLYNSHFLAWKHATDAEIKAQRRLDLPETVVQSLGGVW